MITANQIREILSLYTKHDWRLRRVLLTPELRSALGTSLGTLFASAEIIDASVDAVWLSRKSTENRESWEIRRLSETGYALLEVFEKDDEEDVREEFRKELEARMQGSE